MTNQPRTTEVNLLAAIPQMQPWLADSTKGIWALREPGKQILVYGSRGMDLDLPAESGSFQANLVNQETGHVTAGATIQAGGPVKLPDAAVVWLIKE